MPQNHGKPATFKDLLASTSTQAAVTCGFWTKTKKRASVGLLGLGLIGGGLSAAASAPYTLLTAGVVDSSAQWWQDQPSSLAAVHPPERTLLLDKNGKKFATLYSENRVQVNLKQISPAVAQALIATEDARFYEHAGMDPRGITRALVNNILNGRVQGASTLTQQLVQNIRIQLAEGDNVKLKEANASTISGKIEEVRLAQGLESSHSKDQILEAYLNLVYFGNGAYGVEAAAQRYWSKNAQQLTIPEAATLVAMMKSPINYDPLTNPERSRERRDVVMKRMVQESYITEATYQDFIKTATKLKPSRPKQGCGVSTYPYYCQLVVNTFLANETFGATKEERERTWKQGGLVIKTALDPKAMDATQRAVDRALGRNNRVAAGVAQVVPGTGYVAAIAQNRTWGNAKKDRFDKTQLVYPATNSFQVGSTFKPITAAAALEAGFSKNTKLNAASPMFFKNLDEPVGGFKNDSRRGYGAIDLATAFKSSVNTYFVGLVDQVGVTDVAAMARRLGMKSMPTNLTGREGSITLGAYETSPLQLATVYATFAARGVACDPIVMLSATQRYTGAAIPVPQANCHQEISQAIADTISETLQAPFTAGGTAKGLNLADGRLATGKTGTTDDAAATWFAGYTPQVATAVWIGDPRGGSRYPLNGVYAYGSYYNPVFGRSIAGPIWQEVMNAYNSGLPKLWYPKPEGVSASMTSRIVPSTVGLSLDAAVSSLLESGFRVELAAKTAKPNVNIKAPNYVMKQAPLPGRKAAYGDLVTLTLSTGSDTSAQVSNTIEELMAATRARQNTSTSKDSQ